MPNALLSRKEPRKALKGLSRNLGFTAIETLVFLAVIVIITSLAMPSWQTVQERKHLISGAEQVAACLGRARAEAVMHGETLTVSWSRDSVDQWCLGLSAGPDGCNCEQLEAESTNACRFDSSLRVFSRGDLFDSGILDSVRGDGALTFDPQSGTLVNPQDKLIMGLISDSGRYSLSVELAGRGDVRICSENSNTKVPGYPLC
jgi:Tfp pilus assembly protein FimT